jgi:hypothetical protein
MICFRIVARVGCKRCLVTGIPDEWSPALLKVCTEPGLQTVWPKYPIRKAALGACLVFVSGAISDSISGSISGSIWQSYGGFLGAKGRRKPASSRPKYIDAHIIPCYPKISHRGDLRRRT